MKIALIFACFCLWNVQAFRRNCTTVGNWCIVDKSHSADQLSIDPCDISYDAITIIRNELFIFKGRYLWRMDNGHNQSPEPIEIDRIFFGLPNTFDRIDTVYENKHQKVVFFIGKQYYVLNPQHLEPCYPKPLTHLGLPERIEKIDAALVWSHNNGTYLFSGHQYWRLDEHINRVDLDYPQDMSMWKGIGSNIDSAFQYRDGKTYFFKGKGYWRFDDQRMKVDNADQLSSAQRWMKCPGKQHIIVTSGTGSSGGKWTGRGRAVALVVVVLISLKIVAI